MINDRDRDWTDEVGDDAVLRFGLMFGGSCIGLGALIGFVLGWLARGAS